VREQLHLILPRVLRHGGMDELCRFQHECVHGCVVIALLYGPRPITESIVFIIRCIARLINVTYHLRVLLSCHVSDPHLKERVRWSKFNKVDGALLQVVMFASSVMDLVTERKLWRHSTVMFRHCAGMASNQKLYRT
jgi:hypothetical protein